MTPPPPNRNLQETTENAAAKAMHHTDIQPNTAALRSRVRKPDIAAQLGADVELNEPSVKLWKADSTLNMPSPSPNPSIPQSATKRATKGMLWIDSKADTNALRSRLKTPLMAVHLGARAQAANPSVATQKEDYQPVRSASNAPHVRSEPVKHTDSLNQIKHKPSAQTLEADRLNTQVPDRASVKLEKTIPPRTVTPEQARSTSDKAPPVSNQTGQRNSEKATFKKWGPKTVILLGLCLLLAGSLAIYIQGSNTPTQIQQQTAQEHDLDTVKSAAAGGNSRAQAELGRRYLFGQGVPQDYAQARKLIEKAAKDGVAEAYFLLGMMYDGGEGVRQDYVEAFQWLKKAAEQGHLQSQAMVGMMYQQGEGVQKNDAQARYWYEKAAQQGDANSQATLGEMYRMGEGGPKDYAQAFQWFEKAAKQGDKKGQTGLGLMYYRGLEVRKDYVQARQWFESAAQQGGGQTSLFFLGTIYALGRGVEQDIKKAKEFLSEACANGHKVSCRAYDELH